MASRWDRTRARRVAAPVLLAAAAAIAGCHDSSPTGPSIDVAAACGSPTGVGVDVGVGGVTTVSDAAQMSCIVLPPAGAASEYVFVVANANPVPDVVWRYSVAASGGACRSSTARSAARSSHGFRAASSRCSCRG